MRSRRIIRTRNSARRSVVFVSHGGQGRLHTDNVVLDLVGLIYDAAGNPALWPVFLEQLGRILQAEANTLYLFDGTSHRGSFAFETGFDPVFRRSYAEYFISRNVYLERGAQLLRPGHVCPSELLCPDEIALRSEFYNEWIRPQKHRHGVNAVILKDGSVASVLGAIRSRGAPAFTEHDLQLLYALMPHLQRAVQLHRRITDLELHKRATTDALNRWPLGVILVDHNGHAFLMNRAAEAIMSQRDGLTFGQDGLQGATPYETNRLRTLIHGATKAQSGQALNSAMIPGGSLLLPRPSLKRPLNVLVTPICANKTLFPQTGAAAVIFISDPEAEERTSEDLLRHFYGLTGAEAGVAALLLAGQNLPAIADQLAVTLNTAKTHAKRIYERTGTRGQAEFVRLALCSPASLSGKDSRKHHPIG